MFTLNILRMITSSYFNKHLNFGVKIKHRDTNLCCQVFPAVVFVLQCWICSLWPSFTYLSIKVRQYRFLLIICILWSWKRRFCCVWLKSKFVTKNSTICLCLSNVCSLSKQKTVGHTHSYTQLCIINITIKYTYNFSTAFYPFTYFPSNPFYMHFHI